MATELISAAPALTVPCIVFALRREAMYFHRVCPFQQRFVGAPCRAYFCGSEKRDKRDERDEKRCQEPFSPETVPDTFFRPAALMVETGVGAAAMAKALRWCLGGPRFAGVPYRPSLVLLVGFSGALQAEQLVGDLVLATEVVDPQGNSRPTFRPEGFAERNFATGRLLTMPELVGEVREKERLGRQYQAIAVDMESAVAARLCFEHHVPFACLRVISDDWKTPLSPHLIALLKQGRVSIPRLAACLVRHPVMIGELWRLARQTRLAARRLVKPLTDMVFRG